MIHINRSGASLGTFSEEDVREGLRTGRFIGTDLGWREGMATWQPLSQFSEFGAAVPVSLPSEPPVPASTGAPPPTATATETPVFRTGLPWEHRGERGLVAAFFETVSMILTGPVQAFSLMKTEGGFDDPLIFALIGGSISTVIWILLSMLLQSLGMFTSLTGREGALQGLFGFGLGGFLAIIRLVLTPIIIAVGLFVWAAIVHLFLMLVGGAKKSFETSFRALSFAYGSTSLFLIVPCCGWAVALFWGLVADCIGLACSHETDTGRAAAAVLVPLVVCCGGATFLLIMLGGIGALLQQQH